MESVYTGNRIQGSNPCLSAILRPTLATLAAPDGFAAPGRVHASRCPVPTCASLRRRGSLETDDHAFPRRVSDVLAPARAYSVAVTTSSHLSSSHSPDDPLDERRLRRLERSNDARPLDAWERYRALVDVVDDYREQLDSSDRKTRFALIIMGLLNAVNFLLIARSDLLGAVTSVGAGSGRWLAAYAALYAFVSLYFFAQAIDALRPRGARVYRGSPDATEAKPGRRLRAMAHVALQDPDEHYELWLHAEVGQLSREVAFHAQALARINVEKNRALARVYNGLVGLTALTALLVTALAFRAITA